MRHRAALLLTLVVGCRSDVVETVDVEDHVAFFATFDADDQFINAGRLEPDSDVATIAGDDGGSLWLWSFAPDQLTDSAGRPLDRDAIESVRLSVDSTCGRCAVPNHALPLRLEPGDDCPLPRAVEPVGYGLDGGSSGPLPPVVPRIVRDGTCAPEPNTPIRTGQSLTACPLWPPRGPINTRDIAVNEAGTVFGLDDGFVYSVDAAAELIWRRTQEPHRERQDVAPLYGTDAFVYAVKQQSKSETKLYFYIARPGIDIHDISREVGFYQSQVRLRTLSGDPGAFYVIGEGARPTGVARCETNLEAATCTPEPVAVGETCGTIDVLDLASTGDGSAIGIDDEGFLHVRFADGTWACRDAIKRTTIGTPDGRLELIRHTSITNVGDRWFACIDGTASAPRTALVTGTLGPDRDVVGPVTVVDSVRGGACLGLGVLPDAPDVLVANFGTSTVFAAMDGTHLATCAASNACSISGYRPDTPFYLFGPVVTASTAAYVSDRGHVFVRRPGRPFEQVYGAAPGEQTGGAIATSNRGVVAFTGGGPIEVGSNGPACDDFTVTQTDEGPWTLTDVDTSSISTSSGFIGNAAETYWHALRIDDQRYLVAGDEAGRGWFVRTIDLDEKTIRGRFVLNERVNAMARLDDERGLIVRASGLSVISFDSLEIETLEVMMDDPETEPIERRVIPTNELRTVDVADGVAWVGGRGVVIRVVPTGDEVRAEGWWLPALRTTGDPTLDFAAIRVLAPDRWIGLALEPMSTGRRMITGWRVGPRELDCPGAALTSAGLAMCPYDGIDLNAANSPQSEDLPLGVIGPEDNLTWTFRSSAVYRYMSERVTIPLSSGGNLVSLGDTIIVGGLGPVVGLVPK